MAEARTTARRSRRRFADALAGAARAASGCRRYRDLAWAAWLLPALGACSPRPAAPPRRVVVIVVDTLRADHLPFYGYSRPSAPFLTSLARDSVVFERAYSPASWTAPATASLFTGLYPQQHGVVLGLRATRKLQGRGGNVKLAGLPAAVETLPQVMGRAGYTAFGLTQNINISEALGFERGFERFRNQPADDTANVLHERLLAWKARLERPQRTFLYLHYLDPHSPYRERAPWFDAHRQGLDRTLSAYDSEIAYVDRHLERAYHALGWQHDTLLVVTADHGEEFGEHGGLEHGRSLYGEVLHVPLLLRFPGGRWGGRRVAEAVSLVDVLPTLRDAVGQPPQPRDAGRSLLPLVRGEHGPARQALAQRSLYAHLYRPEPASHKTWDLRATLHDGYKLVFGTPGGRQLFDLHADPLDGRDLLNLHAGLARDLEHRYLAFERAAPRFGDPLRDVHLDAGAHDALRGLGYVE